MPNEPMRLDCPRIIRRLRHERGMTLAQTALGAGTTAAQIMKLENGDRRLTLDWLERLSRALDCHVLDLIAPARTTLISGFLTSSWAVQPAVHDPRFDSVSGSLNVPVPRGSDPDEMIVIRRQTLDRADFFAGATFYFNETDAAPVEQLDGRISLLTLDDGARHVRRVVIDPSSKKVQFTAPDHAPDLSGKPVSCVPCMAIAAGSEGIERLCGPELQAPLKEHATHGRRHGRPHLTQRL